MARIRDAVREKYREVSASAAGKFRYQTGKKGAETLGYDSDILKEIPGELLNSFCGVGNPFSLGDIPGGSSVLDIGCGGGFDLIVARKKVGKKGRVSGVDLTREMIERARKNLAALQIDDIDTRHVDGEQLPFADATFDIIISNGVINLSPAKDTLFQDIYRVLKPGGTLQFADIILEKDLPPHLLASPEAWSQ